MAKKKSNAVAAKAQKKAKAVAKIERKEKKKNVKSKGGESDSDEDLEGILEKMRKEWEEVHTVTEELVEPPSRRANAMLTPCPVSNYLWCIGGEYFSEDRKQYHFYNDVFRYTPERDEWRKFVSPTCLGPRSAHAVVGSAVVGSAAGGGKLFLFGGEFSSLNQTTFHHYGDFWCFDNSLHSWDRIETKEKEKPHARSGCRMAMWKHYVVLFGGFVDPGAVSEYLNGLWIFETQEYKWHHVEFRETDIKPL
ncbi:hypothetical protein BDQ17DRAFT_1255761 [Cyathus striatus]|nr:hypothetical protein BDQ17DRAFT_1255761 [Cyathus striatus]